MGENEARQRTWRVRRQREPSGTRRAHRSHVKNWSGKRDSNPRLRPWQGRTLPLSYSRPRTTKVPQRSVAFNLDTPGRGSRSTSPTENSPSRALRPAPKSLYSTSFRGARTVLERQRLQLPQATGLPAFTERGSLTARSSSRWLSLRGALCLSTLGRQLTLTRTACPDPQTLASRRTRAASSGDVGLMYNPVPHSKPATLVSRGISSRCQW